MAVFGQGLFVRGGNWAKPCRDCGKTEADGTVFGVGSKRANGKQYRKSYCLACARIRSNRHDKNNPEQAKAREARRDRKWGAEDTKQRWEKGDPNERRRMIRRNNVSRLHGISLEEYEFRFQQQGGCCTICDEEISLGRKGPGRPAHLDHDHATGKLRDFLCDRCNVMVGMSRESQDILSNAVLYLEKYRGD